MQGIFEIFHSGGFVMYPLAICSLLTWAIAIERFWSLRQIDRASCALGEDVSNFVRQGKKDRALEISMKSQAPLARILEELLKDDTKNVTNFDLLAEKAQRRRLELAQTYKKNLWILGTIGSATPFLGLFGTVVGILRAFKHISTTGDTGFTVVASGISEALIATAAGILVAVIAVAFYNYFQVKVGNLYLSARLSLEEFLDALKRLSLQNEAK